MRVLLLVHRIPYPPDKGDKIRSWRLLEALSAAHEVDLVALVDDPADFAHHGALLERCASAQLLPLRPIAARLRAAAALVAGSSISVAHFAEPAAAAAVRLVLERRPPEVVVAFSGQTVAWLPPRGTPPLVADLVDVDSEKFAQYAAEGGGLRARLAGAEAPRLRRFEAAIAARARSVLLTTEREARLFRGRVADVPVEVVPNGVDVPEPSASATPREPALMVFVGAMDYAPNVEAAVRGAREILPRVRAAVPDARFRVVGRKPAPAVTALAAAPGVEVTGAVPDVRPHLAAASLALTPLRVARGVQNKALEALAAALPLVATPDVAESLGLPSDGGGVVATGADAAELATRAVDLLKDPAAAARLGAAGRAFVAERFRWDRFGARLLEIVARAAGRDPAAPARRKLAATAGEPRT